VKNISNFKGVSVAELVQTEQERDGRVTKNDILDT
jgi:hypothetical protein